MQLTALLLLAAQAAPHPSTERCGQPLDATTARLLLERELLGLSALPTGARRLHVPLALHVVRASDGTGGIGRAQLQQALADAIAAFAPAGIAFVALPIDVIADDAFVDVSGPDELQQLKRIHKVPYAINCYFVESLFGGLYYGISSYSSDPDYVQGIVVANKAAGTPQNPSTFPHEIGHYLDLLHTFDEVGGPACTSGADCRVTGDLVCDTPAETYPAVGAMTRLPDCAYVGAAPPPCAGDPPYAPDLTNLMSGGFPPCRTHFTPGQLRRARTTLVLFRPELLVVP
jgi:hypothetical protein